MDRKSSIKDVATASGLTDFLAKEDVKRIKEIDILNHPCILRIREVLGVSEISLDPEFIMQLVREGSFKRTLEDFEILIAKKYSNYPGIVKRTTSTKGMLDQQPKSLLLSKLWDDSVLLGVVIWVLSTDYEKVKNYNNPNPSQTEYEIINNYRISNDIAKTMLEKMHGNNANIAKPFTSFFETKESQIDHVWGSWFLNPHTITKKRIKRRLITATNYGIYLSAIIESEQLQ